MQPMLRYRYLYSVGGIEFSYFSDRPSAEMFRLAHEGGVARVEGYDIPVNLTLLQHKFLCDRRDSFVQSAQHVCTSAIIDRIRPCWGAARRYSCIA